MLRLHTVQVHGRPVRAMRSAGVSYNLQAWLRSRGEAGVTTYTSDDVIANYGVVKGT